jgi:hypothetical protein
LKRRLFLAELKQKSRPTSGAQIDSERTKASIIPMRIERYPFVADPLAGRQPLMHDRSGIIERGGRDAAVRNPHGLTFHEMRCMVVGPQ